VILRKGLVEGQQVGLLTPWDWGVGWLLVDRRVQKRDKTNTKKPKQAVISLAWWGSLYPSVSPWTRDRRGAIPPFLVGLEREAPGQIEKRERVGRGEDAKTREGGGFSLSGYNQPERLARKRKEFSGQRESKVFLDQAKTRVGQDAKRKGKDFAMPSHLGR